MKMRSKMPCTLILIAIWAAVWLVVTCIDISPMLCGKGISKIGNAYYRVFTAGLTHKHILHLLANAGAMLWTGYLYEQHIGSFRFSAIGTLCALIAQFIFLCIYPNVDYSIGGSVYPFAFLGFGIVTGFLVPDFPKIVLGTWSGNWLAIYAVASNIPYFVSADVTIIVVHAIALALGAVAGAVYFITDGKRCAGA